MLYRIWRSVALLSGLPSAISRRKERRECPCTDGNGRITVCVGVGDLVNFDDSPAICEYFLGLSVFCILCNSVAGYHRPLDAVYLCFQGSRNPFVLRTDPVYPGLWDREQQYSHGPVLAGSSDFFCRGGSDSWNFWKGIGRCLLRYSRSDSRRDCGNSCRLPACYADCYGFHVNLLYPYEYDSQKNFRIGCFRRPLCAQWEFLLRTELCSGVFSVDQWDHNILYCPSVWVGQPDFLRDEGGLCGISSDKQRKNRAHCGGRALGRTGCTQWFSC